MKLMVVALGGAAGSVLRYAISGWVQHVSGGSFPVGTLAVNVIGCFLLGFLGAAFAQFLLVREETRLLVVAGALGAFTTFSTFGFETFTLANDGQRAWAIANILLSNGAGLAAVWIGYRFAEYWYGG